MDTASPHFELHDLPKQMDCTAYESCFKLLLTLKCRSIEAFRQESAQEEAHRLTNDILSAEGAGGVLLLLFLPAVVAQNMATRRQNHHGLLFITHLASLCVALQALQPFFWWLCRSIHGNIFPRNVDMELIRWNLNVFATSTWANFN